MASALPQDLAPAPELVGHLPLELQADPSRVVIRPFMPADDPPAFATPGVSRAQRIANRVLSLDSSELDLEWERVSTGLADRHYDFQQTLSRRYHEVNGPVIDAAAVEPREALLFGGYFSEEYSFEAAALFNPSIVAHPDQSTVAPGAMRLILPLRGVGEGHISSVTFRTGIWSTDGSVMLDLPSAQAISPRIERIPGGAPDDPGIRLFCDGSRNLPEVVIYPITDRQRQGIEDLRLVRFVNDDGIVTYFGTYTPFGGGLVRQE